MKDRTKIITGALITFVVLIGGGVAANWAPDKPLSALAARWAPPPSTFVPILGMQVHLRDEGPRGDPIPNVRSSTAASYRLCNWRPPRSRRGRRPGFEPGPAAKAKKATPAAE